LYLNRTNKKKKKKKGKKMKKKIPNQAKTGVSINL
jgi:hypothetical protein